MFAWSVNPWIIGGAVAAAVALWGHGYWQGASSIEAAYQQQLTEQRKRADALDRERMKLQRERDSLAQELEAEAYEDPVETERALSPDRVRRLNRIR